MSTRKPPVPRTQMHGVGHTVYLDPPVRPERLGTTTRVLGWFLVLALKVCLAICTLGLYPLIPWLIKLSRWSNVERAANRYGLRQAGRRRYEERQRRGW